MNKILDLWEPKKIMDTFSSEIKTRHINRLKKLYIKIYWWNCLNMTGSINQNFIKVPEVFKANGWEVMLLNLWVPIQFSVQYHLTYFSTKLNSHEVAMLLYYRPNSLTSSWMKLAFLRPRLSQHRTQIMARQMDTKRMADPPITMYTQPQERWVRQKGRICASSGSDWIQTADDASRQNGGGLRDGSRQLMWLSSATTQ